MLPREHYLKQAFQDPIHFPDGFEKGGLSDIQARLVRKNGTLINALSIDEVSDPTTEDLHLLKVIANQSSPKNPVEQAWVKYLSLVKSFAVSNPKGKSKAKASKPVAEIKPLPEPVKDVEKAEKPTKIAEKADTPKTTDKKSPKKVEAAPLETKTKAAPAKAPVTAPVKNEKAAPAPKAPAKAAAKKPEPKKEAPKKAEVKKPEPKKAEPKKADVKKAEPKKADTKKLEAKVEAKKTPAKKTKS